MPLTVVEYVRENEYRIDWGPGYRLYLAKDSENLMILLSGGTKRERRHLQNQERKGERYGIDSGF